MELIILLNQFIVTFSCPPVVTGVVIGDSETYPKVMAGSRVGVTLIVSVGLLKTFGRLKVAGVNDGWGFVE